jgi:hypothetical protein
MYGILGGTENVCNPRKYTGPSYAPINRNFMNYPLARDTRLRLLWRKDQHGWHCDLPGEDRIQLQFARDAEARCPSAFDVEFLFRLFGIAKKRRSSILDFASFSALLKSTGYEPTARNRRRVKRALKLWSELSLWFDQWYEPTRHDFIDKHGNKYREWKTGRKKRFVRMGYVRSMWLPPALRSVDIDSGCARIRIDKEWRGHWKSYYKLVPLPLPSGAAAQNLALKLLTLAPIRDNGADLTSPEYAVAHRLTTKIRRQCGLLHNNGAGPMKRAIKNVEAYYTANGGDFEFEPGEGEGRKLSHFHIHLDIDAGGRDITTKFYG